MQLLMKRIEELMAGKKMFLEPELTLQQIATALNEKERNISQAINTLQQRNLNDYINSLRIEYACRLLLENREKPIFEVMYESGFSTKGAFNLAFKKTIGKTPTQYREG
jgi:AraC-like DNA-binding protein